MAHGSAVEREIKLEVRDVAEGEARLASAGFRVARERVFEANTVFDDAEQSLRARGCVLRIREAGSVCTLTYKGPGTDDRFKIRPETELTLSDPAAMARIFAELGFSPTFRYEKYRTEFRDETSSGGVATLDETPIGCFLELEGDEAWIEAAAARMNFPPSAFLTASYGRLYVEYCMVLGVTPGNMVFPLPSPEFSTSGKSA